MFTIKVYDGSGRVVIRSAESFTILRDDQSGEAEITLHQRNPADDSRLDIKHDQVKDGTPIFSRAVIENEQGKTTEVINLRPAMPRYRAPGAPESVKEAVRG